MMAEVSHGPIVFAGHAQVFAFGFPAGNRTKGTSQTDGLTVVDIRQC
jgi:hypothetical protein